MATAAASPSPSPTAVTRVEVAPGQQQDGRRGKQREAGTNTRRHAHAQATSPSPSPDRRALRPPAGVGAAAAAAAAAAQSVFVSHPSRALPPMLFRTTSVRTISLALLVVSLASACLFVVAESADSEVTLATLSADVSALNAALDGGWLLLTSLLIFLMQIGFAMLEAGAVSSKDIISILLKNLTDVAISSLIFWLAGNGFQRGSTAFIGASDAGHFATDNPKAMTALLQATMVCAVSVTIVSGAVACRFSFHAYMILCVFSAALIYPVGAGWVWGERGWLSVGHGLGAIDYAGGAVVHLSGACIALTAAVFVGPRIGRFVRAAAAEDGHDEPPSSSSSSSGRLVPSPDFHGNSIVLTALGTLLLWVGWYGFNCSATHGLSQGKHIVAATIAVNTSLAASGGLLTGLLLTRFMDQSYNFWDALNATLAGLVGSTAGCATVGPAAAFGIGVMSAGAFYFSNKFILRLCIDDVVGAFSVHGPPGAVGLLCAGLFSRQDYVDAAFGAEALDYSPGKQLGTQLLLLVSIVAWSVATSAAVLWLLSRTVGIRVSADDEIVGLDFKYHSGYAYESHHKRMLRARKQIEREQILGRKMRQQVLRSASAAAAAVAAAEEEAEDEEAAGGGRDANGRGSRRGEGRGDGPPASYLSRDERLSPLPLSSINNRSGRERDREREQDDDRYGGGMASAAAAPAAAANLSAVKLHPPPISAPASAGNAGYARGGALNGGAAAVGSAALISSPWAAADRVIDVVIDEEDGDSPASSAGGSGSGSGGGDAAAETDLFVAPPQLHPRTAAKSVQSAVAAAAAPAAASSGNGEVHRSESRRTPPLVLPPPQPVSAAAPVAIELSPLVGANVAVRTPAPTAKRSARRKESARSAAQAEPRSRAAATSTAATLQSASTPTAASSLPLMHSPSHMQNANAVSATAAASVTRRSPGPPYRLTLSDAIDANANAAGALLSLLPAAPSVNAAVASISPSSLSMLAHQPIFHADGRNGHGSSSPTDDASPSAAGLPHAPTPVAAGVPFFVPSGPAHVGVVVALTPDASPAAAATGLPLATSPSAVASSTSAVFPSPSAGATSAAAPSPPPFQFRFNINNVTPQHINAAAAVPPSTASDAVVDP